MFGSFAPLPSHGSSSPPSSGPSTVNVKAALASVSSSMGEQSPTVPSHPPPPTNKDKARLVKAEAERSRKRRAMKEAYGKPPTPSPASKQVRSRGEGGRRAMAT